MIFLDTNILVYSVDKKNLSKQGLARDVVADAISKPGYMVSAQVLNEFANVGILKLGLSISEVRRFLSTFRRIKVAPVLVELTERALSVKEQYGTQYFDSLLLATAEANGCDEFWSEDLNDGQIYCGMKAVNPFKGAV